MSSAPLSAARLARGVSFSIKPWSNGGWACRTCSAPLTASSRTSGRGIVQDWTGWPNSAGATWTSSSTLAGSVADRCGGPSTPEEEAHDAWIDECETRWAASRLATTPSGDVASPQRSYWALDAYSAGGTEGGRNAKDKALVNAALASAAARIRGRRAGQPPETALVLDGARGLTCRALMMGASGDRLFRPADLFVPNLYSHVVATLRRDLGVRAFTSDVGAYLEGGRALKKHALVFLDLTKSFERCRHLLAPALGSVDARRPGGGILALTISARSYPGADWSRALAVHTAVQHLVGAARDAGLTLRGLGEGEHDGEGGKGLLSDYHLYSVDQGGSEREDRAVDAMAQALAETDVPGLVRVALSPSLGLASGVSENVRAKTVAAAKALDEASDGGILGLVQTQRAGAVAVLGAGRKARGDLDKHAKRLVRLSENLVDMEAPGLRAERRSRSRASPTQQTVFRGAVHLYVGQIITLAFRVEQS